MVSQVMAWEGGASNGGVGCRIGGRGPEERLLRIPDEQGRKSTAD